MMLLVKKTNKSKTIIRKNNSYAMIIDFSKKVHIQKTVKKREKLNDSTASYYCLIL